MIGWEVLFGAAFGAAAGYGGARLAPRWMSKPPRPWEFYVAAAVNGLLVGLLAARHGLGSYFWAQILFVTVLTTASLVDLHDKILPDPLVAFGLVSGLLLLFVAPYAEKSWLQGIIGMFSAFAVLFILAIIVPGGMGMGDVKLAAVIGLFLGFPWAGMGLVLSFLAGGLVSALLLTLRIVGRKSAIPFGPWLALGSVLTVLYGQDIWLWYISLQ